MGKDVESFFAYFLLEESKRKGVGGRLPEPPSGEVVERSDDRRGTTGAAAGRTSLAVIPFVIPPSHPAFPAAAQ